MNISIVIGVSKYSDAKNNLPGCKNDAEAIQQILQKTNKFHKALYINGTESSAQTKELITNFIKEYEDKQIDELFFYFSGHGEFINDEFYYILSDFDSKKRNQTTLQNREMDDLIKTLKPKLVVKVIDACQSGTTYIKEINTINKYFQDSKLTFNNCYFLNSSLNNQSSYQDNNISRFTNSFIAALKNHNSSEIRYKDIIDSILDYFANDSEQTPFFVIQALLTEKFCSFSDELKKYLSSITYDVNDTGDDHKTLSIADLIIADSKDYVDKDGALKAIEFVKDTFANSTKLNADLESLFLLEVSFLDDHSSVPQLEVINNWIKSNKNEYIAEPIYKEYYNDDDPFNGYLEDILVGFDLKIDTSYKAISIEIAGKYSNLSNYKCMAIFLLSKKFIRFFFFITDYNIEGWSTFRLNYKGIQWETLENKIADDLKIKESVKSIYDTINARLEFDIKERLNLNIKNEDLPF